MVAQTICKFIWPLDTLGDSNVDDVDFITIWAGFFDDDLVGLTVGDFVGKHEPGAYLIESH